MSRNLQQPFEKFNTTDLKVGMYVMLPTNWLNHPFFRSQFQLKSETEIRKIRESGLTQVKVDLSRSDIKTEAETPMAKQRPTRPPGKWKPEEIVPPELKEALKSNLPSEEKATIMKKSSMVLMDRLLEDPSAANLKSAKQGIYDIVDCVISDSEVSHRILDITNHDLYTYTHCVNVGFYALLLAKSYFRGSTYHNMREIGAGFFLHDLGKVSIDPNILNKPGRLDDSEMEIIRRHPREGAKMLLMSAEFSEEANAIVMQHHERVDGSGYPYRLKGSEISLYAIICSVADVYDALTSERSYKKKLSQYEALKLMHTEMIGHFNKELFEKFVLLFAA